jgi:hypothetical protein
MQCVIKTCKQNIIVMSIPSITFSLIVVKANVDELSSARI